MPDGGTLKERAWAHILEANEWFDGEREITAGVKRGFIADWRENKPSTASVMTAATGIRNHVTTAKDFPTFREAWAWVDAEIQRTDVTVWSGTVRVKAF